MAMKLGATTDYLLGLSDEPPAKAGPNIKTGDINGSFNIVGNHNTIAPPQSSTSSSPSTPKKRKARNERQTRG